MSLTVTSESVAIHTTTGMVGRERMHLAFLEHAETGDAHASERAVGAFLVLTIADAFHDSSSSCVTPRQIHAARRYVEHLFPRSPETAHLTNLIGAVKDADGGAVQGLAKALVAYADWLHEEQRLAEALDVLATAHAIAQSVRDARIEAQVLLLRARSLRVAGRSEDAFAIYESAGVLSARAGDVRGEMLSRIGRAATFQQVGNVPAAEQLLVAVVADAARHGDLDAEARATHDLAVNSLMQNQPDRAAIRAFRAYQLYDDPERRIGALSDAGIALHELGYHAAARDAFELVLAHQPSAGMRTRASLELLALEIKAGDQLAFDARRGALEEVAAGMPPRVAVDFDIKLGQGYARFGPLDLARRHYRNAIARAERHHLNELLFRAEKGLEAVGAGTVGTHRPIDWATRFPEVAEVAGTLRTLLID